MVLSVLNLDIILPSRYTFSNLLQFLYDSLKLGSCASRYVDHFNASLAMFEIFTVMIPIFTLE